MDFKLAKQTLTSYLGDKNLRLTQERLGLFEEVMKGDGHFDADGLYATLKQKGIKVSRATVYNTLDLLVECGLISRYSFGENHSRYERAFGRPRHDHLICLKCGDIIEFVNESLNKIQNDVCATHKFRLQNSTLQIFGICSTCQTK